MLFEEIKEKIIPYYNKIIFPFIIVLTVIILYLSSLYHYLLFHSIAEIFSIVIACAVFMLSWNSREYTRNHYLVYLGIAYLFIGIIDLFHTLSYKGMNIFRDYDFYANQLWIAARYMEAITLLIFFIFAGHKKRVSYEAVFLIYAVITVISLASVFYWKIFPICFIEGEGLTPFKKISEYMICMILFASGFALYKSREEFDEHIRRLMAWTIILTILGELAFTFYISNYGFSNLVGHYMKIASFYLVYKAIIETGIRNPFQLIFKRLKESEERYKNLFNTALVGIFRSTPDGSKILAANPAAARIFAYDSVGTAVAEFIPRECYVNPEQRIELFEKLNKEGRIDGFEILAKDRNGNQKWLTLSAAFYQEQGYIEGAVLDITEQIENRNKIAEANERDALQRGKIEMAGSVLHDIGNAVTGVGTTVARLIGEDKWNEIAELKKLEQMTEKKREALAAALGPGKEEALLTFIRELKYSIEERSRQLNLDFQTMAKTISHINEILHLQRRYTRDGQAGKRSPVDLSELIEDAIAMNAGGFEKRGISVHRNIPADIPQISGDRTKLIRVFLNLFKNTCEAFDSCERKDDRVIDIAIESLNQSRIRVIVSDNAIGFDSEQSKELFKPGFSTKSRDSGMGLSQCLSIIESHNGLIRLESPGKDQGARAVIELPI